MPTSRGSRKVYRKRKKDNISIVMAIVLIAILITVAILIYTVIKDMSKGKDPAGNTSSTSSISSIPSQISSQSSQSSQASSQTPQSSQSQQESSSQAQSQGAKAEYGEPIPASGAVGDSYFADAAFVGDSLTDGIKLYSVMKDTTVLSNTGINVETIFTKECIEMDDGRELTMLDALKEVNPKKIYIMLGANGIAWFSRSTFVEYYGSFIDEIKAQHPNSTIYVQSILPVTKSKSDSDSRFANSKINEFNQGLMQMCKEKQVYYVNVAEALKDANGALPEEASLDGIHFGVDTYNKWFDYLKTHTVSQ